MPAHTSKGEVTASETDATQVPAHEAEPEAKPKASATAEQPNQAEQASAPDTTTDKQSKIDIKKLLIKVQGGKMYLPVPGRLVIFRHEKEPLGWSIETIAVICFHPRDVAPDNNLWGKDAYATYRCEIRDQDGRLRATGHKTEDAKGFGDFAEKAETGSIGRALAILGYGTEYTLDFNEVEVGANGEVSSNGSRFHDSPKDAPRSQNAPQGSYDRGNGFPSQQPPRQPQGRPQEVSGGTQEKFNTEEGKMELPERVMSKVNPDALWEPQVRFIECTKCHEVVAEAEFDNGKMIYNADGKAHPPVCGKGPTGYEA